MEPKGTVRDLMTREVVFVHPETPLLDAANLMYEKNFSGLPVVDRTGAIVGIMTEYDLLTKGSALHLPTFLKLMNGIDIYRKDQSLVRPELEKMFALAVKDVMNTDPMVLTPDTPIPDALRAFGEHHKVNPIPIVDNSRNLVGILSRFDIIKLYAGTNPHPPRAHGAPEATDRAVSDFLTGFEKNFLMVSRSRTRYWLLISMAFLILGIVLVLIFTYHLKVNY